MVEFGLESGERIDFLDQRHVERVRQDHPERRLDELLPGAWARGHADASA